MKTEFQTAVCARLHKRKTLSQPQLSYFIDEVLRLKANLIETDMYQYEKDILTFVKRELEPTYQYMKYMPVDVILDTYEFSITTTPKIIYTPSNYGAVG